MHMSIMRTPGLVIAPPDGVVVVNEKNNKELVQKQVPIARGKELCQNLRQMRVDLAKANGIPYYPKTCNHTGPCAGTCQVCDEEMRYINQELHKISPERRVYPKYDISTKGGL